MTHASAEPEAWLEKYGDMLYRYALLRVQSQQIAEDLVQDTLLAGIQGIEKYHHNAAVSTWLVGIMKHKIIDYYRKNATDAKTFQVADRDELLAYQFDTDGHWQIELVDWQTPEKALDSDQFWQIFRQCLSRLPKAMADLFMLRVVQGLSSEDCCKVLELNSTNQLWVNLSRTRMKLRQCLETLWFDKE